MRSYRRLALHGVASLGAALVVHTLAGCGGTTTLRPTASTTASADAPIVDAHTQPTDEQTTDEQTTDAQTDARHTAAPETHAHHVEEQRVEEQRVEEQRVERPVDEQHLEAEGAQDAATPPRASLGSVVAPLQAQLEILERQSRELEQVATAIAEVRGPAAVGRDGVPPLCVDHAPIEALRIQATSGNAGASTAASAVGALERWCEPFDRWIHPDDRDAMRVRGYLQQVDRVLGWMHDLQRCEHTSGAELARCVNAYSDVQRAAAEEAGRAITLLDEHARELSPVRTGDARFPCSTPTLARIDAVTWHGSVARAQMTGLSRRAMDVCHTIGVADADVRTAERRLHAELDRAESTARAQRRNALEAIEALRGYVE